MAFELDRRGFMGAASVAAATTVLGGGLLAGPACAAAAAGQGPVLTLHMGMPEIDPSGRAAPYRQTVCPGRNIRDHGDWWTY